MVEGPRYTERMSVLSTATTAFLSNPRPMLIGAEWREALSGQRLEVRDPATGDAVTSVPPTWIWR